MIRVACLRKNFVRDGLTTLERVIPATRINPYEVTKKECQRYTENLKKQEAIAKKA